MAAIEPRSSFAPEPDPVPSTHNAAELAAARMPNWLVLNRNFVFLWLAYGIAAMGDHLSEMALLQERGGLARPDVTRVQALMSFGFFLPFVLLGPIAGWWSDRFSRRTTMIIADVVRAVLVFNLAFIVLQLEHFLEPAGEKTALGDLAIVLPLALVGSLAAFFSPARQALLPTLVRDDQLVRANAMINALGTVGGITGAVVGGALVDAFGQQGLHYNYKINAATFILSALFVSGIAMSRTRAVQHVPLQGVWAPIAEGFRYVRQHRRVLQMILLGSVFWAAAGVVTSVIPAIVRDVFGGSFSDIGVFRGLVVVGLAAGAGVMSWIGPALPTQLAVLAGLLGGTFWLSVLLLASVLFGGAAGESGGSGVGAFITGLSLFGIGGAGAAILVSVMATIQRIVPDSRLGRVCGVADTATMGAMVAASGVLGLAPIPNLDKAIPWLLLGTAAALGGSTWAAWRIYRRGSHQSAFLQFMLWLVRFYARFWCRMKRVGPCTLPGRGGAILACNHASGVDPILLSAASPVRTISFLVEKEQYEQRGATPFMKLIDCVPIDRTKPEKSSLQAALDTLGAGGILGIFPQGRIQRPEEEELEARPGIGLLALRSGVPVIPCHIDGVQYHDSIPRTYLLRHKVRVRFGRPVPLDDLRQRPDRRAAIREASARIMQAIDALAEPGAPA